MDQATLTTLLTQLMGGLSTEIKDAINGLPTTTTNITNTTTASAPKMKVKEPETYDGKSRGKAAVRFILSCENYFAARPADFPSGNDKVRFALSYLSGIAQGWGENILKDALGAKANVTSTDWAEFKKSLDQAFGDPDKANTAIRELEKLTQGNRPMANYIADFRRLMGDVDGYSEKTFMHMVKMGMNEAVKDAMVYMQTEPKDFDDLAKEAIKIDTRLYERRQEKGHSNHPTPRRPQPVPAPPPTNPKATIDDKAPNAFPHSAPVPIHIDAQRRGRITPEERQRRQASGACFYCGQSGHVARACPNRRMAQVAANTMAPSTSTSTGASIDPAFIQSLVNATIAAMQATPKQAQPAEDTSQQGFPDSE